MNIITIGNLSYNINIFLNSNIVENQKHNIVKQTKSIGDILNISLILSKNDLNIYYFSNLGDDIEGKEIINYLHSNKINTDFVNILNNTKTTKQYVIRNNKNNSKTYFSERDNNKYELNRFLNFQADIIYNNCQQLNLLKQLKSLSSKSKIITNLTEITEESLKICKMSNYIIIPLKYAEILSNTKLNIASKDSIIELYTKTKKLFSGKIIIYIEEIGTIFENNNVMVLIPKMGNKNLVSNNSYDIFIATFIYSIANNFDLSKTIKICTIAKFLSDNNKETFNIKEVIDIYEKDS